MARIGVSYEIIERTAIKLLSRGIAPSVQKIRDELGTGSNTTIAEHLKTWREEYASQKVHALPANLPKELIASLEVLWQTAMKEATAQLSNLQAELESKQEKLTHDKASSEHLINDYKSRLEEFEQRLQSQTDKSQELSSKLATVEQLNEYLNAELERIKQVHQKQLGIIELEKGSLVKDLQLLRDDNKQLSTQLSQQLEKHQQQLYEERCLHEQSENRWLKLIDEARTETKIQHKAHDKIIAEKNSEIETLKDKISSLVSEHQKKKTKLEGQAKEIKSLKKGYFTTKEKYDKSKRAIAILEYRLSATSERATRLENICE